MSKNIHEIFSKLTLFYPEHRDEVVTGSRVFLRRNLDGYQFAHQLIDDEQVKIRDLVEIALKEAGVSASFNYVDIHEIKDLDIIGVKNRSKFNNNFVGAFINQNENISILINFEDHLCIQATSYGYNVNVLFAKVNALDNLIAEHIDFAYSNRLGFLTVSPKNVGTGLTVEVGMHLGALKFVDEIQQVLFGLDELGFRLRELFDSVESDSSAIGGIVIVANRRTLGVTEQTVLDNMAVIVDKLRHLEIAARERYFVESTRMVQEQLETFKDERKSDDLKEFSYLLEIVSFLKLGIDSGVIRNITYDDIYNILDQADISCKLDLCSENKKDTDVMNLVDSVFEKLELVEYIDE
jgi:protein arginine kinase